MPEPDDKPPSRTSVRHDQLIRAQAIRAAATFLANDETATEGKLFDLARRITHYIEGRRRDT